MKKITTLLVFVAFVTISSAQNKTGIGTNTPEATLEIVASNQVTPANTDGILIPRIDAFPVIDPAVAQDAMMVYLTTTDGTDAPGFYYWNNASTSWLAVNINYTAGNLINIAGSTIHKKNNLQIITVAANVSIDAVNVPEGIFRFDMTSQNNITITNFNNVVDGGVYNFHLLNATNGAVTFPASFVKEDGSPLGAIGVTTARIITFYHYQGTNYTMEQ